jgi:tetratricopeptide (TPR) repeat protein
MFAMRLAMRICLVLLAALAAGCGSRSAKMGEPDRGAWADELVRQGCYDCLLDARAGYERLATSSAAALARVFEVDLLLALREKELSIDPTATLAHAESLVPRLAGAGPPKGGHYVFLQGPPEGGHYVIQAERLLAIVRTVPEDAAGRRILPPTKDAAQQIDSALAALDASPFSTELNSYLRLTIQCGRTPERVAAAPANDIPLLAYRRAICTQPVLFDRLRAVRTAVPRFVEASFFLGRVAMASIFRTDGSEVRAFFEQAYARFPNSPTIAFDLGTVYQATNECRPAERLFTRVLELKPAHEEARLGRAVCRTYLSQNEEAVADATVLIDARASNRAEAYYWRAWNRRHLKQIQPARADIDMARSLRYNARVLTLAGMIEYDQRDFVTARSDLTQARDLDPRECDAPWYLGLVEIAVEAWPPGAKAFAGAAQCYEALVNETEKFRADMAARKDVSDEFRKRQLAGFDAAIADDNVRKSAAELNAAINYGRAGDIPNATVYMKRAAVDPQRRTAVEDLRQVLGVPRW